MLKTVIVRVDVTETLQVTQKFMLGKGK